ncbi:septum site-determining protein MinC [Hydrogenispora ethanolica]|jgi:septum site-determining protein MinC|uniref:Probable septum site-determining protein MinC n=1 Tax=Hydrogenispora ethanolica TaxID=1082276 RepID=A0A4R1RWI2_HYDET|nr:septum site-determining protein MinC [Hydrogenispora ethanolica]TCL70956.1 septum site-determining protein MinC [Hydrogenispora ethanolica]
MIARTGAMAKRVESVVFKGYKSGLTLIIPEQGPFDHYLTELKARLEQSKEFFRGVKISVKIGKRQLSEADQEALKELLQEFGLIFFRIVDETVLVATVNNKRSVKENDEFIGTITVKRTIRSGQRVEFEGNLVIMGDVNPGAEVAASGDIVVLGKLRGTAHAGATGNQNAKIYAFYFNPVQIRIAEVITRAPEAKKRKDSGYHGPEVAKIKDGLIMVEPALV